MDLLSEKLLNKTEEVSTADALKGKIVGLYFSAHWCGPCRHFTPTLAKFYKEMQTKGKEFEIIFVSSDRDETAFKDYYAEHPWLALPYSERDAKNKLSKKFKVQGIPTLVLLDEDGNVITTDARSAVSKDPEGENFPWKPKPLSELLACSYINKDGKKLTKAEAIDGKITGIYFSAHWCPPCRGFTPELIKSYNNLKAANKNFEIVFASSDRDQAAFDEYYGEMPWLALPYDDRETKEALSKHFGVEGIPTFVILDEEGKVITTDGRSSVSGDPEGKEFPWRPKPLNDLTKGPGAINDMPSLILFSKDDELISAIEKTATSHWEAKGGGENAEFCFFFSKSAEGIAERVLQLCKVADKVTFNKPFLLLLDIPDDGGYYVLDETEITSASFDKALEDYAGKKLTRKQLG